MLPYFKRLFFFSLPLVALSLPFVFQYTLFKISGENSFQFDESPSTDRLVGYKYDNFKDIYYKYNVVTSRQHAILGIGSSRILQFRQKFFTKSFYAWNIINYSTDYLSVLETLKANNKTPEYILLQLDERTFNKDFDQNKTTLSQLRRPNILSTDFKINSAIIKDYLTLNRKSEFKGKKLEGLGAQYFFSGYRNDGSYQYGKLIYNIAYNRSAFDSTFSALRITIDSTNTFLNIKFSQLALDNLEAFLDACTKSNIHVIGFFQPYPKSVMETLKDKEFDKAIYYTRTKIEQMFKTKNHLYINANVLPNDDELNFDGIHPNESSNVNLLQTIPKNSVYRKILNEKNLKPAASASKACLDFKELADIKKFFESTRNF